MTLEENIRIILECGFLIAKEEVIESVTKRIMEQISRQESEALKDIGEISSCLVSIMDWESCYYQRKDIYEKAKKYDSGEVDFYE